MKQQDAMGIFNRIEKTPAARNTIIDSSAFEKELVNIREQRYSLDHKEWFDDINGAAVPIFSEKGFLIASLSTHALATRKSISELKKEIQLVVEAAHDLTACLRHS